MRRLLTLALVAGVSLVSALAAVALASNSTDLSACTLRSASKQVSICPGGSRLVAVFGGQVVPKGLPKHETAPVAVKLWGKIATNDGTHPSALRELTADLDRNVVVDAAGLPVCHPFRELRTGGLRKACRSAAIGRGEASFEVAFPEEEPTLVPSDLVVYNGGVRNGVTTVYAVAFGEVLVPGAIVSTIEVRKTGGSRYGLRAVARVPRIVGANGSLLDFRVEVKRVFRRESAERSILRARCPDGHLDGEIEAAFKNEARTPGVPPATVIKGALSAPCVAER